LLKQCMEYATAKSSSFTLLACVGETKNDNFRHYFCLKTSFVIGSMIVTKRN